MLLTFLTFAIILRRSLVQVAILPPTLLQLTRLLFPCPLRLDRSATLIPLFQFLDPIRQKRLCDLLILGPGARGLRLDDDTCGFVDNLDGGVCFVL